MFYSAYEERGTNYFSFGPQWASSLMSHINMKGPPEVNVSFPQYEATVYGIGGGQLRFSDEATGPDSSTFNTFEPLVTNYMANSWVHAAIVHYPNGAQAVYGERIIVSEEPPEVDLFLTRLIDSYGNTTTLNYTNDSVTALLTNIVDVDGNNTVIRYDATWTTRIG